MKLSILTNKMWNRQYLKIRFDAKLSILTKGSCPKSETFTTQLKLKNRTFINQNTNNCREVLTPESPIFLLALVAGVHVHHACKPKSLLSYRVLKCRMCVCVFCFLKGREFLIQIFQVGFESSLTKLWSVLGLPSSCSGQVCGFGLNNYRDSFKMC